MATYSIAAPDGQTYKIEGPAGASQEQVQAEVLKQHPTAGKPIEKGNMYTQGAEDIVYSPEGIPLTTSSYGSAPTGATKSAQQALTSATGLPLNIATGIAKVPVGIGQAFSKLMGSNAGDVPVNAINQIEKGTQSQMGGVGQVASQVGSMVGQAAPFMGGGSIGQIPSLTQRIAQGTTAGLVSGLATPEETNLTPEQFIKAKAENLTIQGGVGGAFPLLGAGTSKLAGALRGTSLSPQMEQAVLQARQTGYTVPPTQAGGGIVNRALEGLAGKASTLQEASVRNQAITNKLATKSLGLPEDTVLTPEVLGEIRSGAGKAYDAIATLPKKPAVMADSIMNRLASAEIDPKKMVYDLRVARNEADGYYNAYARSADPEQLTKAKAAKALATKIEDDLEKYASDMGKEDLLPALRDARQLIAKTYTVENAMNKTTGTINASEFAKRLQKSKPMSEELMQIGQFAQAFPKASQMPEKIGGTIGISPLDYTAAGLAGGASMLSGEDRGTTSATTLAALLARPAARKAVLSNTMQNKLIQQQSSNMIPAGVKASMPSPEEARQLAKMLLMQRLGSTSENK